MTPPMQDRPELLHRCMGCVAWLVSDEGRKEAAAWAAAVAPMLQVAAVQWVLRLDLARWAKLPDGPEVYGRIVIRRVYLDLFDPTGGRRRRLDEAAVRWNRDEGGS